jgi:hypothetical protein
MKKKNKVIRSVAVKRREILFIDLSVDLDQGLSFVGHLAQNSIEDLSSSDGLVAEFGYLIIEYLGKRIALEHVFFGRSLRSAKIEDSKLRAEVWRLQKMKAKSELPSKR